MQLSCGKALEGADPTGFTIEAAHKNAPPELEEHRSRSSRRIPVPRSENLFHPVTIKRANHGTA
jgi:hypothetical protein